MRKFEIEAVGMGTNNTGYPGAFPPAIQDLITKTVGGNVLHLFSGSSVIGNERVDIEHPNATVNSDIRQFIEQDEREWDWIVLDPPYAIIGADTKLATYGENKAISSDVIFRRKLLYYLAKHTENVLWLDFCAPVIKGFKRQKLWLVLPGGFHTVRVLSWLKKEMDLLL
uniref:Methyltransferase n=1 Tax=viral metagenome TaxID=1070528 RepID=A0A6M3LZK2_9ZZZZ